MITEYRRRSGLWYLLSIFLGVIGGIIAWFVVKDDDPKKASNCFWLGVVLLIIVVMGYSFI